MSASEAPTRLLGRGSAASARTRDFWEVAYRRRLLQLDGMSAAVAAAVGYLVRPGADAADWSNEIYTASAFALPAIWIATAAVLQGYDLRRLGLRRTDMRTAAGSVVALLAVAAWVTWETPIYVPRSYVLLVLTLAGALTLTGRALCRRFLQARRHRGECTWRVLAVGHDSAVRTLVDHLGRDRYAAAVVVGCCVPDSRPGGEIAGAPAVPVLGGLDDVPAAAEAAGANTVAVLPCPELRPAALRRLAWALEGRVQHFVVIPGLTDVAQPRLTVGPIGGVAALHVRHPRLSGPGWLVKAVVDRVVALVALTILAPLLLGIALVVRSTSPGPVIFRQTRVGMHGREFTFLKFRTMCMDAEQRRDGLAERNINADGLLFKVPGDPRIIWAGAFLRRWSLDELPQLINVLAGNMSLVGPRPSLPAEVARYDDDARRRLLVKPGLTGLWQVSGRSDLSWTESVRLDQRYVDNWSLALDVVILSRTVPAVLNRAGAY